MKNPKINIDNLKEWEPFTLYNKAQYLKYEGELAIVVPRFNSDIPLKLKEQTISEISLETD